MFKIEGFQKFSPKTFDNTYNRTWKPRMSKTRKNFTAVQKTVIVRECLEGGYSLSEICEKYQVHPSMVGR